jgi:hypothetical protein
MSNRGRRVVVAFAVLAVALGVVAQRPDVGNQLGVERDRQPVSTVIVDTGPVGVVPAATRTRTFLDGESLSPSGSTKIRLGGLVLFLAVLVLAVCGWRVVRPDRRVAVPMRCSSLPALRAPPTFA